MGLQRIYCSRVRGVDVKIITSLATVFDYFGRDVELVFIDQLVHGVLVVHQLQIYVTRNYSLPNALGCILIHIDLCFKVVVELNYQIGNRECEYIGAIHTNRILVLVVVASYLLDKSDG